MLKRGLCYARVRNKRVFLTKKLSREKWDFPFHMFVWGFRYKRVRSTGVQLYKERKKKMRRGNGRKRKMRRGSKREEKEEEGVLSFRHSDYLEMTLTIHFLRASFSKWTKCRYRHFAGVGRSKNEQKFIAP